MVKGTNMPTYKEEKIRVYFFDEGEDNKQNVDEAAGYYIYDYSTPIGYNEKYQVLINTSNNTWFNTTTGVFQDNNLQPEAFQDAPKNQLLNQEHILHETEFTLGNNKSITLISPLPDYRHIDTFIIYNGNHIGQLFNCIFHKPSTYSESPFQPGLQTIFCGYKVYSNCIIFMVKKPEIYTTSSGYFDNEPRLMTIAVIFE